MKKLEIQARLLTRNAMFNLIGQSAPLLIGLIAIPFIVRGLGTERFGLLSLIWVLLGYFALFDLGLGRATTKYVAEAFAEGEEKKILSFFWSSVLIQILLGLLASLFLLSITSIIVEHFLNIPLELIKESKSAFRIISLAIPALMAYRSFTGFLEAAQRFDLVNAVNAPFVAANFLLPLLGLFLGWKLPGIVMLLVISRFLLLTIQCSISMHYFPFLKMIPWPDKKSIYTLLGFGGWITGSNIIISLFVYMDRFLIGYFLPIEALAYYNIPRELIDRFRIIPYSLGSVLFPAFSSLTASKQMDQLSESVARSIKYMVTVMILPTIFFLLFSEDIMRLWIGKDFAAESAGVLKILSITILLNAVVYIPSALIEGVGRPDVVTKFHLIELPLYCCVVSLLIYEFGITGAAFAWCLRMGWNAPIFSFFSFKFAKVPFNKLTEYNTIHSIILGIILLFLTGLITAFRYKLDIAIVGLIEIVMIVGYGLLVWNYSFDVVDRNLAKSFFRKVPIIHKL